MKVYAIVKDSASVADQNGDSILVAVYANEADACEALHLIAEGIVESFNDGVEDDEDCICLDDLDYEPGREVSEYEWPETWYLVEREVRV